jgi:hypothetical protein
VVAALAAAEEAPEGVFQPLLLAALGESWYSKFLL